MTSQTFTTPNGNRITIEAPDPEKIFKELYPDLEQLKEKINLL